MTHWRAVPIDQSSQIDIEKSGEFYARARDVDAAFEIIAALREYEALKRLENEIRSNV